MLNFNDWENAVESTRLLAHQQHLRVYFVDCSTKVNNDIEKEIAMNVHWYCTTENRGYSAGNNVGIMHAIQEGCKAILISNTDVKISPTAVAKLFAEALAVDAAMIGPRVVTGIGEDQETILGTRVNSFHKVALTLRRTPFRRVFQQFYDRFSVITEEPLTQVYGVSGCCFLVREQAFAHAFPLDEVPFLYNEEYILAEKMRTAGHKVFLTRGVVVVHKGGSSTSALGAKAFEHFISSERYLLKKYLHAGPLIMSYFALLRGCQMLVKKHFSRK